MRGNGFPWFSPRNDAFFQLLNDFFGDDFINLIHPTIIVTCNAHASKKHPKTKEKNGQTRPSERIEAISKGINQIESAPVPGTKEGARQSCAGSGLDSQTPAAIIKVCP